MGRRDFTSLPRLEIYTIAVVSPLTLLWSRDEWNRTVRYYGIEWSSSSGCRIDYSTLAIMVLQLALSAVPLINCIGVLFSTNPLPKQSKYFCLGLPLDRLPSIFPVITKFSMFCCLITCPKNFNCLLLIVLISVRVFPASINTSSILI